MAENRSRTSEDRRRARRAALAGWAAATVIAVVAASPVHAQPGDGQSGPTYQRKGTFAGHGQGHGGDWRRRPMPQFSSQTSAGSFQRPYPYHLDYYRAKWGGSYAPYFGNLYGPPNFFFGTPFSAASDRSMDLMASTASMDSMGLIRSTVFPWAASTINSAALADPASTADPASKVDRAGAVRRMDRGPVSSWNPCNHRWKVKSHHSTSFA